MRIIFSKLTVFRKSLFSFRIFIPIIFSLAYPSKRLEENLEPRINLLYSMAKKTVEISLENTKLEAERCIFLRNLFKSCLQLKVRFLL